MKLPFMIRKALRDLSDWGMKSLYSRSVIMSIDGLPVVSVRDDHTDFQRIITRSFELLRANDPRRFKRIVSSANWVVDCSLPFGARSGQYRRRIGSIEIDFEFSNQYGDDLRPAAYYAALLVHEGTHGFLLKKGYEYTPETRVQTERICVAEENRFLSRLDSVHPGLGESLMRDFDPEVWEEAWTMGPWEAIKRQAKRVMQKDRDKQDSDAPQLSC